MLSLKSVFGFLLLILILHGLATFNYWYWTYKWLDMVMHFLGGVWLSAVFFYLISNLKIVVSEKNPSGLDEKIVSKVSIIIVAVGFVALIGIFWEYFEFFYDLVIFKGSFRQDLGPIGVNASELYKDTLSDLFFDILGGFVGSLIFFRRRENFL